MRERSQKYRARILYNIIKKMGLSLCLREQSYYNFLSVCLLLTPGVLTLSSRQFQNSQ
jgi:hypothetical protein